MRHFDFSGLRTGIQERGENIKGECTGRKCEAEWKEGESTIFTSKMS